ncbi:UNVERIFIED_CONTAM: hypothetical protein Sindi_2322500 [Sesamum indicum]
MAHTHTSHTAIDGGGDPTDEEDIGAEEICHGKGSREGRSEKFCLEYERSPADFEKLLLNSAGLEEEDDVIFAADVEEVTETKTDSNLAMDETISLAAAKPRDEDDRIAPANGVFQAKECDQTNGETSALISHGKGGTLGKKKTAASAPQFLGFAATLEDDETRDSLPAFDGNFHDSNCSQGFRGMGGTQPCGKDVTLRAETIDPKLGFDAATMGDSIDAESKLSALNELKRRWEEKIGGCELNRATAAPVRHPKPRRCLLPGHRHYMAGKQTEEKEMNTEYARSRFLPEKNPISTAKLQFPMMRSSSPATTLVLPVDDAAANVDHGDEGKSFDYGCFSEPWWTIRLEMGGISSCGRIHGTTLALFVTPSHEDRGYLD